MPQTLAAYQAMVEDVLASKNLKRLIDTRQELINQKREHYDDVRFRNRLYESIRQINDAIMSVNLTYVDTQISEAQGKLEQAMNIVCHPYCFNAFSQADQVRRLAVVAGDIVALMERDRHLSPLLTQRKVRIERLKTDIDSMSRTMLIIAAIEERQQLLRAQEEEQRQKIAAETILRLEQQQQKTAAHARELAGVHCQFDLAINCCVLDQARHALWVIEQAPIDVQVCLFNGQDVSMKLAHMHQQCESLRREIYGRHGIRNLDALAPTTAMS